jgi:glycosyltransferase involved in cell wall biosynthesis
MRIGIMARAIGESGGIGVYTRNIIRELLNLDRRNEYVLFYRDAAGAGAFAGYPNAEEHLITAPNKAMWDQVAIPRACRRLRIDVLFHPKFTAPLFAPCPVVMTVHGADWFIPQQAQYYPRWDVRYMRLFMPLYFRKCARVLSVSRLTTANFERALRLPPGKIQTVYFAPARHFGRVHDQAVLQAVRQQYGLPQRFILTLAKRNGDERKNLRGIFDAYAHYHQRASDPLPLVVGGKECHQFREEYHLNDQPYGADVLFPGWLDQMDLPAIYTLASLYLYPSNLEAFPIPLTEAMACGTPIVTSNVNGLSEISGDAAVQVDPCDPQAIARAMDNVLSDSALARSLSEKGLRRAQCFSWDECAAATLAILEEAACAK